MKRHFSALKFYEDQHWHSKNRQLADETRIGRAILATGAEGVLVKYSGMPMVFTRDEAIQLATMIVNQVDAKETE